MKYEPYIYDETCMPDLNSSILLEQSAALSQLRYQTKSTI